MPTKSVAILGYGYLGEAISDVFNEAGWQVHKVGRSTTNTQVVQADISDVVSLELLKQKIGVPDVVIHSASSGRGGVDAYRDVFELGAQNITKIFNESKLLFTSSSSVYPQTNGEVVTEESFAEPDRETGKILRCSEDHVLKSGGVVMRLSGIYGEGRSVILKKWLKGESKVEEDGRRILNQIHRRDAATAYLKVVEMAKSAEIYNVSESHPQSQLDTLQWLANHYKMPLPDSELRNMNRKRGWTHKKVSSLKLQELGWKPRYTSFTDAVEALAETINLEE